MDRFDRQGLWWSDVVKVRTPGTTGPRAPTFRAVEPYNTGWLPPKDFPNLSGAKILGIDTETKDLQMEERGPGAVRGAAHAVGVSVATEDKSWYFPIRHEYEGQTHLNMDPVKVFDWLRDILGKGLPVVGANLMYDLEVLRAEGVPTPTGELYDVQFAEPLLNEEAPGYDLDTLARQYLGVGKETSHLYKWIDESYGETKNPRKHIWHSPPTLVGPYAETDALQPLKILELQRKRLHEEELEEVFSIECGLIPLLIAMRFRGVCIDMDKAEQTSKWLRAQAKLAQDTIPGLDVWSGADLAVAFDKAGIHYDRTAPSKRAPDGNPSFTKQYLESIADTHPLAKAVYDVRTYEKAANPFVESYLLEAAHNGRVHCQFHPLRSRDYGTVSGRLSSSDPNLQNIPVRHKQIGPMLRGLFIPEPGCRWRKHDYSQIEYRGLAHYAVGRRADALRELYNTNPDTDFHVMTVDMVQQYTGVTLDRRPAKNINFGLTYGMGKKKLIRSLGTSVSLGTQLFSAYHEAMPMVQATYDAAERIAKRRGYIKTILKRRRRFHKREDARKALNALLQGTAADIMKKAMRDIWKSGICDVIGAPHLTVHDELDNSDPGTPESEEAFKEMKNILETCVTLRVPVIADVSMGDNWGACE